MSAEEINLIFDKRDELRKNVLFSIENLLKNDSTKWSPVWYAEALMQFAGFHFYSFEVDEKAASDKVWDVIRVGSFNPVKLLAKEPYQFNESPFFEPYLCDAQNKLFPLGMEYSSSVPYDQNFNFFFSKLNEAKSDLCENLIPLYALVLYGTAILTYIVGEDLAEINAMNTTMGSYIRAKKGRGLTD